MLKPLEERLRIVIMGTDQEAKAEVVAALRRFNGAGKLITMRPACLAPRSLREGEYRIAMMDKWREEYGALYDEYSRRWEE